MPPAPPGCVTRLAFWFTHAQRRVYRAGARYPTPRVPHVLHIPAFMPRYPTAPLPFPPSHTYPALPSATRALPLPPTPAHTPTRCRFTTTAPSHRLPSVPRRAFAATPLCPLLYTRYLTPRTPHPAVPLPFYTARYHARHRTHPLPCHGCGFARLRPHGYPPRSRRGVWHPHPSRRRTYLPPHHDIRTLPPPSLYRSARPDVWAFVDRVPRSTRCPFLLVRICPLFCLSPSCPSGLP